MSEQQFLNLEKTMERIENKLNDMDKRQRIMEIEVAQLKVKSGVWGFIAGAIFPILTLTYIFIRNII